MEDKHHPAVVAHILLHNGGGDSEMVPIWVAHDYCCAVFQELYSMLYPFPNVAVAANEKRWNG
eukprot:scaffold421274_cov61-Attheya_sp.AAC.3